MKKRTVEPGSEDEAILLCDVVNRFWQKLGWITAKALRSVPEQHHADLLMRLQDAASVYGTNFDEKLKFLNTLKRK